MTVVCSFSRQPKKTNYFERNVEETLHPNRLFRFLQNDIFMTVFLERSAMCVLGHVSIINDSTLLCNQEPPRS